MTHSEVNLSINTLRLIWLIPVTTISLCFCQSISFVSETQISPTGSSNVIMFTSTTIMDSVIICATKDGLLLLEDTGADLFQSKYHRPADNINNENSPSVVAYQNYIYYSTGDSILRVLQIIDQDTIVDVASIQLPLPIKHIKRYDNNLLVSGQIEWGQNMFVAVLELSNPEDPTITFMQDIDMPWGGWLHPASLEILLFIMIHL